MRKLRVALTILLVLAVTAGSFFLPAIVLDFQDGLQTGKTEDVPMEAVDLALLSKLAPIQKLQFVEVPTRLSLRSGRVMDAVSAEAQAIAEFEKLRFTFLSEEGREQPLLWPKGGETSAAAQLLIDMDTAFIVWRVETATEDESVTLWLDDETGLMLALEYHSQDLTDHLRRMLLYGVTVTADKGKNPSADKGEAPAAVYEEIYDEYTENVQLAPWVFNHFADQLLSYYAQYFALTIRDIQQSSPWSVQVDLLSVEGGSLERCVVPLTIDLEAGALYVNLTA